MNQKNYTLGTVEASEQLINDLYIELRKKVDQWASITHQTAQARMGYIGQHLVSVATGFPGGRSGARGKDLVLPNDEYAEIKTCYRVDQLGKCNNCGAAVSGIEANCPECGSTDLKRNDNSKWLIGIRHDEEFTTILEPGKLLIKPSKKNVKTFLQDIRATVKNKRQATQENLIRLLNPKIQGWANYHPPPPHEWPRAVGAIAKRIAPHARAPTKWPASQMGMLRTLYQVSAMIIVSASTLLWIAINFGKRALL